MSLLESVAPLLCEFKLKLSGDLCTVGPLIKPQASSHVQISCSLIITLSSCQV